MARSHRRAQVIVIGAGLSGLTAASELHRQGIDVIVLERSSKVGGRVNSLTTSLGSQLDLGGQWIGYGHHRITALVNKASGTIFPTFSRGLPTIARDGRTMSLFSPSVVLAMIQLIILELVSRVYVPQSWIMVTVDKAIEILVPLEVARQLLALLVAVSSTAELGMFSIYSFAKAIPQSGGFVHDAGDTGWSPGQFGCGIYGYHDDHVGQRALSEYFHRNASHERRSES